TVRVEARVRAAVELERPVPELVAEHAVEGRRRLHPLAGHCHLGVAVIVEHVAPDQLAEPGRAEVITDVGETDASRNATRARDRGQYGGLPHAEAMAAGQHRARTKRVE